MLWPPRTRMVASLIGWRAKITQCTPINSRSLNRQGECALKGEYYHPLDGRVMSRMTMLVMMLLAPTTTRQVRSASATGNEGLPAGPSESRKEQMHFQHLATAFLSCILRGGRSTTIKQIQYCTTLKTVGKGNILLQLLIDLCICVCIHVFIQVFVYVCI